MHTQKRILFLQKMLRNFARLLEELDVEQQLTYKGYCVLDDVFDPDFCAALKEDIQALEHCGLLQESGNILNIEEEVLESKSKDAPRSGGAERVEIAVGKERKGQDEEQQQPGSEREATQTTHNEAPSARPLGVFTHSLRKPHILELDMVVSGIQVCPAHSWLVADSLRVLVESTSLMTSLLSSAAPDLLGCLSGLDQFKPQVNLGHGASFPMHFDSRKDVSRRCLTAILYLNPEWDPHIDGGQIRLYPLPYGIVDIAPVNNRLVLFSSTSMLHRVLPAYQRRYCVSMWFGVDDDNHHNRDNDIPSGQLGDTGKFKLSPSTFPTKIHPDISAGLPRRVVAVLEALLIHNEFRRNVFKVVFADEYEASCRQAFKNDPNKDVLEAAMRTHQRQVERLKVQLGPHMLYIISAMFKDQIDIPQLSI